MDATAVDHAGAQRRSSRAPVKIEPPNMVHSDSRRKPHCRKCGAPTLCHDIAKCVAAVKMVIETPKSASAPPAAGTACNNLIRLHPTAPGVPAATSSVISTHKNHYTNPHYINEYRPPSAPLYNHAWTPTITQGYSPSSQSSVSGRSPSAPSHEEMSETGASAGAFNRANIKKDHELRYGPGPLTVYTGYKDSDFDKLVESCDWPHMHHRLIQRPEHFNRGFKVERDASRFDPNAPLWLVLYADEQILNHFLQTTCLRAESSSVVVDAAATPPPMNVSPRSVTHNHYHQGVSFTQFSGALVVSFVVGALFLQIYGSVVPV